MKREDLDLRWFRERDERDANQPRYYFQLEGQYMPVNKSGLVAKVAIETGQTQTTVADVIDALFVNIADSLTESDRVSIPGWLTFQVAVTAARTGRNPNTGESMYIPARRRIKVKAGSKLKAAAQS